MSSNRGIWVLGAKDPIVLKIFCVVVAWRVFGVNRFDEDLSVNENVDEIDSDDERFDPIGENPPEVAHKESLADIARRYRGDPDPRLSPLIPTFGNEENKAEEIRAKIAAIRAEIEKRGGAELERLRAEAAAEEKEMRKEMESVVSEIHKMNAAAVVAKLTKERDALRARVAELEATVKELRQELKESIREAGGISWEEATGGFPDEERFR